jgi:ATP-binding cassette subfamily B multidrug efflux pump
MKNKPTNTMAFLARLWKYLAKYRVALILLFAAMILSNLLELSVPLLSGHAVDAIGITKGGVDFQRVFRNCALMAACFAASSVLSYLLSTNLIRLSQEVSCDLRRAVFQKLVDLPVKYFDTHPAGDLISRICYDIDTVNASLSTDLIQVCTSFITVVGSFMMLLIISPLLSCVFLVTVPISTLFSRRQIRRVHPLFRLRSEKLGRLNGFVEESVSGQKTVRAYGRENAMIERFRARNRDAVEAYYRADYESCILGPSVNFINNLSLSFVSVFGALLYLMGRLTLGSVSSFVLYSRKFSGPIREAANIISEIQAAVAAAERVFRLIDEAPELPDKEDATQMEQARGDVHMQDVAFGYTEGKDVLKDLTIDVQSGSLIAIVGPTGAGKTTIVNLLMRFYDVSGGRILVDGVDVRDIARKQLRLSYAMVLQDTWLFHGTIHDNIAYGSESATREQVEKAAKAAKIHNFILSLPDGYDTIVSDDGVNISKGQKQLLTIARAMLIDAHMLILDEATSNVDTSTEIEINDAMQQLMRGKTCFVIAHRLSTIERADLILVVEHGNIVEKGTHNELMRMGGVYANLYASQFEIQ